LTTLKKEVSGYHSNKMNPTDVRRYLGKKKLFGVGLVLFGAT
jgi:hypothetical protein